MSFKSKITQNISVASTPSTVTDTVNSNYAQTIIGLSFANTSSNNVTISAKLNKSGVGSAFLIKAATVLPGGALIVIGGDQKVVLEAGDSVTAWSSDADTVDAVVSYLLAAN
jgi:hypothetical protein